MSIPTPSEAEKPRIRCRLVMTDNKKYVKHGQALILKDDPQRHKKVMSVNQNKVTRRSSTPGRCLRPCGSKNDGGLPYRHLQGMLIKMLGA